jgi:hypothetical protein
VFLVLQNIVSLKTTDMKFIFLNVFRILTLLLITSTFCGAQSFIPAVNMGGSGPNDIINNPPTGNVGIGAFATYPNPHDPLVLGGDISLFPKIDGNERSVWGRTDKGWLSIYSGKKQNQ